MYDVVGGGLVICNQRNHYEQCLNFSTDPLHIELFLTQNGLQIFHGSPETRCAAYREAHASAICGKVRVATKLSEWPLRAEHRRPLFVSRSGQHSMLRKFNATIDLEDE